MALMDHSPLRGSKVEGREGERKAQSEPRREGWERNGVKDAGDAKIVGMAVMPATLRSWGRDRVAPTPRPLSRNTSRADRTYERRYG